MCGCGLFPVHSTKLDQLTPGCKLKAVDHLCLLCIRQALTHSYGTEPEIGAVFWNAQLKTEFLRYYLPLYTPEEAHAVLSAALSDDIYLAHLELTMQRLGPWLQKRGVRRTCPHGGMSLKCCSEACVLGTKQTPPEQA